MPRRRRAYPLLADDVARTRLCTVIAMPIVVVVIFVLGDTGLSQVLFGTATFFVVWSIFCLTYVVLVLAVFLRPDPEILARWMRAVPHPETRLQRVSWVINGYGAIWWALSGGGVALASMTILVMAGSGTPLPIIGSGVLVLAASWALIAVSFALHYAREHAVTGGFEFAGEQPGFSDFLYLALQLSTTSASSDVVITTRRMRRFAALHGVIAFLFNTVIIAILVALLLAVVG